MYGYFFRYDLHNGIIDRHTTSSIAILRHHGNYGQNQKNLHLENQELQEVFFMGWLETKAFLADVANLYEV